MRVFRNLSCALIVLVNTSMGAAEESIDFSREIAPILTKNCYNCHGPDEESREADLRLDRRESATSPSESGAVAIVPRSPDESELLSRVSAEDEDMRMPPADVGPALTADEITLLRRWISEGAGYTRHWSFRPVAKVRAPSVQDDAWTGNAIDRFVLTKLENAGLRPSGPADPAILIRRVSLDLTGLPPTVRQVESFVSDDSPRAYERLVDRLLASPAYGEHWARVWLDLARYADSQGYAQDDLRRIWMYRDWVIRALNRNMPFDQFTVEQIAGDLLPEPTNDQLIATGFHRNTMTNSEGGTDDEEFRVAAIVDRVNTTMQVWMGITMACAQCHTHKYDPISQHEYYKFFAIMNQTEDADRQDEEPVLRLPTPEQSQRMAELNEQIQAIKDDLEDEEVKKKHDELVEKRRVLRVFKIKSSPIMRQLAPEKHRETYVMIRGNFLAKGDRVEPDVPEAFHPLSEDDPPDRLDLAQWLVDKKNPLTARVTVNRLWEKLFGMGIVETSEDFGSQGEPPSHSELLDWLAGRFMDSGWDTKAMLKTIVMSSTYRQSSDTDENRIAVDPRNRLFTRGPRFRLNAEMVRDQALAIGGLLTSKMYGRPARPPEPRSELKSAFGGRIQGKFSKGAERYRRGVYTLWRRTSPYPSMTTFDAPSREVCTVRRIRTNTPLQALVTLNDEVYMEAAQGMARRILREGGRDAQHRASFAFQLCTARRPSVAEHERIIKLYRDAVERCRQDPAATELIATKPLGPVPEDLDLTELAAWTVTCNVLLNLDETMARR